MTLYLEPSTYASIGHVPAGLFLTNEEASRDVWVGGDAELAKRRAMVRMRQFGIRYWIGFPFSTETFASVRAALDALKDRQITLSPFSTMWMDSDISVLKMGFCRKGDALIFRLMMAEFGFPLN